MNQVTESKSVENTEQMGVKGKVEKKSGKRIGYNYIILKSLKKSQKNDVVTCLYIKSLTDFGICVIKEGSYGDTKDKHGRDIKDRLMWQRQLHEFLKGKVRLPRLLGSFEENGNYYLVLERIRGKSLYRACRENVKDLREGLIAGNKTGMKFLDYMIQTIELLETLHKHQIVHRDVTTTNFMITPKGKVEVIDMELSYSLKEQYPSPPFTLGTYGYMSPEQEMVAPPAVEQDTFSAAAIILHLWTGVSPLKLTGETIHDIEKRVKFFIPHKMLAETIIDCLNTDPEKRPPLSLLRQAITSYREELKKKLKREVPLVNKFSRTEIIDATQDVIHCFGKPLFSDPEKGWFSEDLKVPPNPDKRKLNKAWYASFNKGAAGIIYMLSKASLLGLNIEATRSNTQKAIELIEVKYMRRIDKVNPGLHFGGAGIACTLTTALQEGIIEPEAKYFQWISSLLEKDNNKFTFQHGIAGQGIAHGFCYSFLHPEKVDERLKTYVAELLGTQKNDGSWPGEKKNVKTKNSFGFANGMAGIIYFLLEYAKRYSDQIAMSGAQNGLQWLIKKSHHNGKSINWRTSKNKEIRPWWYQGAPGIALTFLKAYKITNEKIYKDYAVGALQNHEEKVVDNNLGHCSGLSGLGEIYLEAFDILHDQQWLDRAAWIAQVIMHLKKGNNLGSFWLVDREREPVADFGTGNSGIIHFLLRYCFEGKLQFPLMP